MQGKRLLYFSQWREGELDQTLNLCNIPFLDITVLLLLGEELYRIKLNPPYYLANHLTFINSNPVMPLTSNLCFNRSEIIHS